MVAKKKTAIKPLRPDLPIYPIGVAAKLLDVHPRTLRIYEEEGLIEPDHKGARRLFSSNDIKWVFCLRSMIHDQGISIPGLKRLLALFKPPVFGHRIIRIRPSSFAVDQIFFIPPASFCQ